MKIYTKEETIQQYLDDGVPLENIIYLENRQYINLQDYFGVDCEICPRTRMTKDYLFYEFDKIFVHNTSINEQGMEFYSFRMIKLSDLDNMAEAYKNRYTHAPNSKGNPFINLDFIVK